MLIATIICALATLVLVGGECAQSRITCVIAKPLASAAFITVGVLALREVDAAGPWQDYQRWIVIGLVLGAAGDVALLGKGQAAFMAGLGVFLAGHLGYVVACAQLAPPGEWLSLAGLVAAAPIVAGVAALAWLWPHLGSMRIPVIGYVLAIVTMVIAALAIARIDALPERNRVLLALGASLFFVSDLAVARDKFVSKSFANRAWGLPTYYAGQLLIAWSMLA